MESKELILQQLKKQDIKRNHDVHELYLSDSGLTDITDLAAYKNLHRLWITGNKLRRVNCLRDNLRLSELYLQNNELIEITGALEHLTCLQVLMLQNNQLEKLEVVIREMRNMADLRVLNLFHNAVAQEKDYRLYVIHHIPSLKQLDRQEVLESERIQGASVYDQDMDLVRNSLAFGRSSAGPPSIHHPKDMYPRKPTVPADFEVGNNFYRDNPPYDTEEQAMSTRCMHRSVMQRSYFDWSRLPNAEQRRLDKNPFSDPKIITKRFR